MKLFSLILALFMLPCLAPAQTVAGEFTAYNNPTGPLPEKTVHEWTKEQDQVNGRIPHGKLAKMQNTAEALVAFLEDSCFTERDSRPSWHGEYFPGKFNIHCRSEEGKGQLSIRSNDLTPMLRYLTVNGKDLAGIRPSDGRTGNSPYFETEDEDHNKTITWLVTPNDKFPYIEITRKEYLQEARAELDKMKDAIIAEIRFKMPVRTAAVQELDKKASIEELNKNYSGVDLQVRMRLFNKDYQTDEDYQKSSIAAATAGLDKTIRLIDSLSNRSTAAELNKPAMVSVEAVNFRGFEDRDADRNMLVKINPAYFDPSLGSEKPQLFLITWNTPSTGEAVTLVHQVREWLILQKADR